MNLNKKYYKSYLQLNEGRIDSYVKNLIANNIPSRFKPYLNTHVDVLQKEHPEIFRQIISDEQMDDVNLRDFVNRYKNRSFWDFLRIMLSNDLGIHNSSRFYLGGMRIAIQEYKLLGSDTEILTQQKAEERSNKLKELFKYVNTVDNKNGENKSEFADPEVSQLNDEMSEINGERITGEGLFNRFRKRMTNMYQSVADKMKSKSYGEEGKIGRYTKIVVTPENREQLIVPLSEYTSWCIAYQSSSNFDSYISGGKRFYVFLRDDYRKYPNEGVEGEGCPLDDYGLSMMAILINAEGAIDRITTRWNHEHGGEFEGNMTVSEMFLNTIQNLLGFNIFKECPPYSSKELLSMGIITSEEIQRMINSGTVYNEIFDSVEDKGNIYICRLSRKYYIISKDNEVLCNGSFDTVFKFHDGYAQVKRNERYNYINEEGKMISDFHDEFDYIGYGLFKISDKESYEDDEGDIEYFEDEYAYHIINDRGEYLVSGLSDVSDFVDGFAVICGHEGYNYINTSGEVIWEDWFDEADDFDDGYAKVFISDKGYNIIDISGHFVFNNFYDDIIDFDFEIGYAIIEKNNKGLNYINKSDELISDLWFDEADDFIDGVAMVYIKDKGKNFINETGRLISRIWFDRVSYFQDGVACVCIENKGFNFIDKKGEFLFDEWLKPDGLRSYHNGLAAIYYKNKGLNFINKKGEFVFDEWIRDIIDVHDFKEGCAWFRNDLMKYNFLDMKGKLISKHVWFDHANDFKNGFASVKLNNKSLFLDKNGILYDDNKNRLPDDQQPNLHKTNESHIPIRKRTLADYFSNK